MKNKGRKHKAGDNSNEFSGIGNCKGGLVLLTRNITTVKRDAVNDGMVGHSKTYLKKKWAKRVRGYFKSQTKSLLGEFDD